MPNSTEHPRLLVNLWYGAISKYVQFCVLYFFGVSDFSRVRDYNDNIGSIYLSMIHFTVYKLQVQRVKGLLVSIRASRISELPKFLVGSFYLYL